MSVIAIAPRQRGVIPGFGLTLGFTLAALGLTVLIPLAGLVLKASSVGPVEFWRVATAPRTLAALELSFGAALAGAAINLVAGTLVAWCLVRYDFPGRRIVDAMVDLPFALPTAVAGIALATIYAPNGWIGRFFESMGIKVAFTPFGIMIALTFIGLPFVVRSVQPVLQDLNQQYEEAAATLGANSVQIF